MDALGCPESRCGSGAARRSTQARFCSVAGREAASANAAPTMPVWVSLSEIQSGWQVERNRTRRLPHEGRLRLVWLTPALLFRSWAAVEAEILIRDQEGAYETFIRRFRSLGIRDPPTSPRSRRKTDVLNAGRFDRQGIRRSYHCERRTTPPPRAAVVHEPP